MLKENSTLKQWKTKLSNNFLGLKKVLPDFKKETEQPLVKNVSEHKAVEELNIEFNPGEYATKVLSARLARKRFNIRTLILFVVLVALFIAMFFITVCIWPSAVHQGASANFGFHLGWKLQSAKLPGIIVAAIGLSLGGYIVQQVTQNRLADTSILGISTVNIVLLVIVFAAGAGTTYAFARAKPWVLLLVSVITALVIFALSYKKQSNVSTKFVLAGIIINFLFVGFGNTFMNATYANNPIFLLQPYMDGQLPLPSLTHYDFYSALAMVLFATVWLIIISRRFFASNSNYLIAKSIGVNPTNIYFQSIVIAGIFTAAAFILVGNITFLGIATGNIAFFLFKKRPISGIIGTILSGLVFMLFSYFIGNNCVSNSFVPPSMLIPLIVAPIFVLLALKKGR